MIPTALFFILTISAGWGIVSLLEGKRFLSILEKTGFAYGIGMGIISLEAFLGWWAGFTMPISLLYAPWILFTIFYAITHKGPVVKSAESKPRAFSLIEKIVLAAIILELGYAFFRACIYPMESYDSVAIWALKAKAIYLAQGLPLDFFRNPDYITAHLDYPLLIPIQEALFYKLRGIVDDAFVKAIFPMYLAALAAILYGTLRKISSRKISLIFTFLLISVPQFKEHATIGYADIVVAFYYSAGLFAVYRWMLARRAGLLLLSALMSAMAAWTKPEGVYLSILSLCAMILAILMDGQANDKKRMKEITAGISAYLIALAVFVIPWNIFARHIGLTSDLITDATFSPLRAVGNLGRLPTILYEYQKQFFGFKRWNIIWVLFWAVFFVNFKKIFRGKIFILTVSILGAFFIYTAVYIVTPKDFPWHIKRSLSRVLMQILPVVILWLAVMYENWKYGIINK